MGYKFGRFGVFVPSATHAAAFASDLTVAGLKVGMWRKVLMWRNLILLFDAVKWKVELSFKCRDP